MADFNFAEVFESGPDETAYRKLDVDGISSVPLGDEHLLKVEPVVLEQLAFEAFRDCQHLLRASHLQQLRCAIFSTTPRPRTTTATSPSPC